MPHPAKRQLVDTRHPTLSIAAQAAILNISRSSIYYQPRVDPQALLLTKCIDAIYTEYPFYGSRRIAYELATSYGMAVNRKAVQRLMRLMGLEAIYPKPSNGSSDPDSGHKKYPYLLNYTTARYPNHIWGTDITYVRLESGFAYLVALLDWFSRYVISWKLAPTLEIDFCLENLEDALREATPKIHNSDQGSHFTSPRYTDLLTNTNVQISMDGRGRCMDNIFTERLWRTVKYENIYIKSYVDIEQAHTGLSDYFQFYNTRRPHQSLSNRTPEQMYLKNYH